MEVEPVPGDLLVQLATRQLAEAADALRAHPEQVERERVAHPLHDVGAEPPTAAVEVVHDDDAALELTGPANAGRHGDAVLDHPRPRAAAVPHQVVERADVNDGHVRIVDPVPSVGWVLSW